MAVLPQYTDEELDRSRLEISDAVLAERLARVTPLYLKGDRLWRFKTLPDARTTAFAWGPEDDDLILVDPRYDHDEQKSFDDYREVSRGSTHHTCGYHAFVKPTIAEVLAQLPDDDRITAFYLDLDSARILYDGEGHIINVYWLSDKPETIEERRARYARRNPGQKNIY